MEWPLQVKEIEYQSEVKPEEDQGLTSTVGGMKNYGVSLAEGKMVGETSGILACETWSFAHWPL